MEKEDKRFVTEFLRRVLSDYENSELDPDSTAVLLNAFFSLSFPGSKIPDQEDIKMKRWMFIGMCVENYSLNK